jgi:hypothetical protein
MEFHSYQGSLGPLWNSTAMAGVHSYGIPEQVQTDSGTASLRAGESSQAPVPACFSHNSCMTVLCHRSYWSPEVLAPHEKFHCSKLARFA